MNALVIYFDEYALAMRAGADAACIAESAFC
jgi:hypothetical protein